MITAAKPQPTNHDTLEHAINLTQGQNGANFEQIITEYERQAGPASAYEFTTALQQLVTDGRITRTKGPRGENLYRLAPQAEEDPVERLQREKLQLQQALGALTTAVTFATARLDQHQKRDDHWRELIQANDEAKQALEDTQ